MATFPTIHLGGTSRTKLAEELATAADAIRAAIDALHEAAPNGRDYYPQGPDAFFSAQAEHIARLGKLGAVLKEIEALQVHVADS